MFDYLKKLTGRPLEVEAVEYRDDVLRFRCNAEITAKQRSGDVEVTTTLPDGQPLKLKVAILTFEVDGGLWVAEVLDPPEAREVLIRHYAPAPPEPEQPKWTEKRAIPRLAKVCGVNAREFPGFRGLTHDMTHVGARLVAEGPLPVGSKVLFQLDLDDARLDPIKIQGEVKWCLPKDARHHFIGVHFLQIDPEHQAILAKFIEECWSREAGVIGRDYQLG